MATKGTACGGTSATPALRGDIERLRSTIIVCGVVVGVYSLIVGGIHLDRQGYYGEGSLPTYAAAFAYATFIVNVIVLFTLLKNNNEIPKSVLRKARIFLVLCPLASIIIIGVLAVSYRPIIPFWDAPRVVGCLALLGFIHNLLGVSEMLQPSLPADNNGWLTNIPFLRPKDPNSPGKMEEDHSKQRMSDNDPIVICN